MESNFKCLAIYWSRLAEIGEEAEIQLYQDNNACVAKIGIFAECLTEEILQSEHMQKYIACKQFERIEVLREKKIITSHMADILHKIRMIRNDVSHGKIQCSAEEAEELLYRAYSLTVWFLKHYSDIEVENKRFEIPCHKESNKLNSVEYGVVGQNINEKHTQTLWKVIFGILFLMSVLLNIYFIFQ